MKENGAWQLIWATQVLAIVRSKNGTARTQWPLRVLYDNKLSNKMNICMFEHAENSKNETTHQQRQWQEKEAEKT